MEKNISEEEILSILTQDTYYRKIGTWPLLTTKDIIEHSVNKITTDYFMISKTYQNDQLLINNSLKDFTKNLNEKHPFTTELLTKFNGHIVACGGSIAKNLISNDRRYIAHPDIEDVDIFFHSIDTESASKLRMEIIEFLVDKWKNRDDNKKEHGVLKMIVLRNEFVTTIYFTFKEDDYYMKTYSYQLIHRIYPNISSIIGGFDLSVCMISYDGNELYATPLGAWALKNHTVIIDTKRRSTSFEYRICKYYDYGFNILFPGLTQKIVDDYILKPCRSTLCDEQEVFQKICNIAREHRFNIHHFAMARDHDGDILFLDQQKKENILPYLNINDGNNELRGEDWGGEIEFESYQEVKLGILPYNMKNIENRYITKISDYSHNSINLRYMPDINATRLRLDNLSSVVSVLKIKKDCFNINQILSHEASNPDLKFTPCEIENFISRAQEARNHYGSNFHPCKEHDVDVNGDLYLARKDTKILSKCFGKLALEIKEIRDTDQYDNYVKMMIEKMIVNERKCRDNLTGIKWMTQDPGRQWTSSINPIIANPRDWYGKHYVPVLTGIPEEIETLLRLMRLERTNSVWSKLNDDIFNLLLQYIMKSYADDAWEYIEDKNNIINNRVVVTIYDEDRKIYKTMDDFLIKVTEDNDYIIGHLVDDQIVPTTNEERKTLEADGFLVKS
jgi:hypothetical protein